MFYIYTHTYIYISAHDTQPELRFDAYLVLRKRFRHISTDKSLCYLHFDLLSLSFLFSTTSSLSTTIHRIKHKKLKIVRPPASVARYTMIRHAHRPESPNNIRFVIFSSSIFSAAFLRPLFWVIFWHTDYDTDSRITFYFVTSRHGCKHAAEHRRPSLTNSCPSTIDNGV